MIQIGMTNQPVLEIGADNGQIVLKLLDPKDLVDDNSKKNRESLTKISIREKISEAKDFAKYLTNNSLTISIQYKDKGIIILGNKAKSKFLKLITGGNKIQIKNLRHLKKLDNELFNA